MIEPRRISLLVSDVDGTLVTQTKVLTPAVIAAARALTAAGIKLALVSSRPPQGFAMLTGPLQLSGLVGAYNGGAILTPDLAVIEASYVPVAAARLAIDAFRSFELDCWLYDDTGWHVTNDAGTYVAKETNTIQDKPILVRDFEGHLAHVGKLVGSSSDFARVAACETALAAKLGTQATARRSQPYYLDVTPHGSDKGAAVRHIARRLSVPLSEVAVIGDMDNDIPMFETAPVRIAMGNGSETLKRLADFVTDDNEHDGWAAAIERFILPNTGGARPASEGSAERICSGE